MSEKALTMNLIILVIFLGLRKSHSLCKIIDHNENALFIENLNLCLKTCHLSKFLFSFSYSSALVYCVLCFSLCNLCAFVSPNLLSIIANILFCYEQREECFENLL